MRPLQRAIIEFDLLTEGDQVLVGLSGGKDSLVLLYALNVFIKYLPFSVKLGALTVDLGFVDKTHGDNLKEICQSLQVPYFIERVELAEKIMNHPTQNPCAQCAYFRRAVMHNFAQAKGFNKVAWAHHYDDAVETFLMSILYSGQITTFLPKTYLEKTQVTVIRPLVYLREKDIKGFIKQLGWEPLESPCSLSGQTKRAEVKELIRNLQKTNPALFTNLAAAMRQGQREQRWPALPTRKVLKEKSRLFWLK